MTPINVSNGKGTYEVRIGLWAPQEQALEIQERLSRVLCPDAEHPGPCEVPWSIAVVPPEAVDEGADHYDELVEQAKIEGTY